MAFLLLFHEKMRLKRQINKLTFKQARQGGRLDRLIKNIEKKHKIYDLREARIDQQAKMLMSQATTTFQRNMGLGAQNQMFNPFNMSGNSITSFVYNDAFSIFTNKNGLPVGEKGEDGKPQFAKFNQDQFENLYNEYASGTLMKAAEGKDGKPTGKYGSNGDIPEEQVRAFQMAMRMANNNQMQAQNTVQQLTADYQNGISIWVEAQKSQIQQEEDEALAPLELKQTEMELEKDSIETQLAYAKARLEGVEQACSEGIKDSAPKFGLG